MTKLETESMFLESYNTIHNPPKVTTFCATGGKHTQYFSLNRSFSKLYTYIYAYIQAQTAAYLCMLASFFYYLHKESDKKGKL